MIKAEFRTVDVENETGGNDDSGKAFCFVKISGHSGYAELGSDIVCAAVSSAVQLFSNTLTEEFGIPAEVSVIPDRKNSIPVIKIELNELTPIAEKLFNGFYRHCVLIQEQFPKFIDVNISK